MILNEQTAEAIGFAEGRISRNNSLLTDYFHECIVSQDFDLGKVESMKGLANEIEKDLCYIKSVLNRMRVIADQQRLLSENAISNAQQRAMQKIEEEDE